MFQDMIKALGPSGIPILFFQIESVVFVIVGYVSRKKKNSYFIFH